MTAGPWPGPGPASERLAVLAAALRAGAAGLYCAEAGVELLIGQESWLRRSDFTGSFIAVTPGLAGRDAMAAVGWHAAITALDGGALPCSSGERRILHLAASIAAGTASVTHGARAARPARSSSVSDCSARSLPNRLACTPADHTLHADSMRRSVPSESLTVMPLRSTSVTMAPNWISTPIFCNRAAAR